MPARVRISPWCDCIKSPTGQRELTEDTTASWHKKRIPLKPHDACQQTQNGRCPNVVLARVPTCTFQLEHTIRSYRSAGAGSREYGRGPETCFGAVVYTSQVESERQLTKGGSAVRLTPRTQSLFVQSLRALSARDSGGRSCLSQRVLMTVGW